MLATLVTGRLCRLICVPALAMTPAGTVAAMASVFQLRASVFQSGQHPNFPVMASRFWYQTAIAFYRHRKSSDQMASVTLVLPLVLVASVMASATVSATVSAMASATALVMVSAMASVMALVMASLTGSTVTSVTACPGLLGNITGKILYLRYSAGLREEVEYRIGHRGRDDIQEKGPHGCGEQE